MIPKFRSDVQSYYSMVHNAIFFPNHVNRRDNRVTVFAHLQTLDITVSLDMPASIFNRAGELFLSQSHIDIFNTKFELCLEITASGHNQGTPRNTLIVDSFTIVRRIESIPSPVLPNRSIVQTGLKIVKPLYGSSVLRFNDTEASGLGQKRARKIPRVIPAMDEEEEEEE
ncbi:hypothetical protein BDF21DRAFT_400454 [Thamnidium elegans]|uniref:Uncharacterized protein n=1 Tax=Thamnidium elegans TaxID=101142 RepID=A0A8H7SUS8_9FUNG|nr:hypothetical protein INT48_000132 [Thamnidium elegans]KAI8076074.1 hypothetical protein BDF21DRAFT_400454 [Thamnidium elegans]